VAASIGFDAITVALLGRGTPVGTVLAGLLFGALNAGGLQMQLITQTPADPDHRAAGRDRAVRRGSGAGALDLPVPAEGTRNRARPRERLERMTETTPDAVPAAPAKPQVIEAPAERDPAVARRRPDAGVRADRARRWRSSPRAARRRSS
jgi:hypothetical protein